MAELRRRPGRERLLSSAAQETCCEPEAKASAAASMRRTCGCSAGDRDRRLRDASASATPAAAAAARVGGCCSDARRSPSSARYSARASTTPTTATRCPTRPQLASLGCGNPTAVADLHEGETVLDLGSGGGIDVLLSARRVGPTGKAYGLDMTDEMLELARANQREAGVENVEFLKGRSRRSRSPTTRSTSSSPTA